MAKSPLGRGLNALLGGATAAASNESEDAEDYAIASEDFTDAAPHLSTGVRQLKISEIRPCEFQPRREFEPEALGELADSIKEQGIVQPLLVRKVEDAWEIIAGERRWRAAKLAGLAEVPVIEREATNQEVLELALIENLQRENLNPIEEALGYQELIQQFNLSQEQAAAKVGKSRTAVTNSLRLLKLPEEIRDFVRTKKISTGHAKVILGIPGDHTKRLISDKVINKSLSVRETEELVAKTQQSTPPSTNPIARSTSIPPSRDLHTADLENRLRERLGTKVTLRYRKGRGSLDIKFYNQEDLERILEILGVCEDSTTSAFTV